MSNRSTPPGLNYMVAHGYAADGSHARNTESTQHLVHRQHANPTTHEAVRPWIARRVEADLQMRSTRENAS